MPVDEDGIIIEDDGIVVEVDTPEDSSLDPDVDEEPEVVVDPVEPPWSSSEFVSDTNIGSTTTGTGLLSLPHVPSGYDPYYLPVEREPWRADWAEAEFRPELYDVTPLTILEIESYREADAFLYQIKSSMEDGEFVNLYDYFNALEQTDPERAAFERSELSRLGPIYDELGERYRYFENIAFQERLGEAQSEAWLESPEGLRWISQAVAVMANQAGIDPADVDLEGLMAAILSGNFTPGDIAEVGTVVTTDPTTGAVTTVVTEADGTVTTTVVTPNPGTGSTTTTTTDPPGGGTGTTTTGPTTGGDADFGGTYNTSTGLSIGSAYTMFEDAGSNPFTFINNFIGEMFSADFYTNTDAVDLELFSSPGDVTNSITGASLELIGQQTGDFGIDGPSLSQGTRSYPKFLVQAVESGNAGAFTAVGSRDLYSWWDSLTPGEQTSVKNTLRAGAVGDALGQGTDDDLFADLLTMVEVADPYADVVSWSDNGEADWYVPQWFIDASIAAGVFPDYKNWLELGPEERLKLQNDYLGFPEDAKLVSIRKYRLKFEVDEATGDLVPVLDEDPESSTFGEQLLELIEPYGEGSLEDAFPDGVPQFGTPEDAAATIFVQPFVNPTLNFLDYITASPLDDFDLSGFVAPNPTTNPNIPMLDRQRSVPGAPSTGWNYRDIGPNLDRSSTDSNSIMSYFFSREYITDNNMSSNFMRNGWQTQSGERWVVNGYTEPRLYYDRALGGDQSGYGLTALFRVFDTSNIVRADEIFDEAESQFVMNALSEYLDLKGLSILDILPAGFDMESGVRTTGEVEAQTDQHGNDITWADLSHVGQDFEELFDLREFFLGGTDLEGWTGLYETDGEGGWQGIAGLSTSVSQLGNPWADSTLAPNVGSPQEYSINFNQLQTENVNGQGGFFEGDAINDGVAAMAAFWTLIGDFLPRYNEYLEDAELQGEGPGVPLQTRDEIRNQLVSNLNAQGIYEPNVTGPSAQSDPNGTAALLEAWNDALEEKYQAYVDYMYFSGGGGDGGGFRTGGLVELGGGSYQAGGPVGMEVGQSVSDAEGILLQAALAISDETYPNRDEVIRRAIEIYGRDVIMQVVSLLGQGSQGQSPGLPGPPTAPTPQAAPPPMPQLPAPPGGIAGYASGGSIEDEGLKFIGKDGLLFDPYDPVDWAVAGLGATGIGGPAAALIKGGKLAGKAGKIYKGGKRLLKGATGFDPATNVRVGKMLGRGRKTVGDPAKLRIGADDLTATGIASVPKPMRDAYLQNMANLEAQRGVQGKLGKGVIRNVGIASAYGLSRGGEEEVQGGVQESGQELLQRAASALLSPSMTPEDERLIRLAVESFGEEALLNAVSGLSQNFAAGGYVGGFSGGMDDVVPAVTDGVAPAKLSSGEFVVPADVVSHIGDGNNDNGAMKLHEMLDRVRVFKTGNTIQPSTIPDNMIFPS